MDVIKKNWFSESCEMWPGSTFSFEVKKLLHKERSPFQEIQVFDSTSLGRVLVLDGIIQCTQKDEYSYQVIILLNISIIFFLHDRLKIDLFINNKPKLKDFE